MDACCRQRSAGAARLRVSPEAGANIIFIEKRWFCSSNLKTQSVFDFSGRTNNVFLTKMDAFLPAAKSRSSPAARESRSRRQHHLHRKTHVLPRSKKSSALYIKTRRWYDSKLDARGNTVLIKWRVKFRRAVLNSVFGAKHSSS